MRKGDITGVQNIFANYFNLQQEKLEGDYKHIT